MAILRGAKIGKPGPATAPPILFLYGEGDATASTNPDVQNAQVGSLYSDYVNGNLWFKQTSGWTQLSIP